MNFSTKHALALLATSAIAVLGSSSAYTAESKGDIGYVGFALNTSFLSTFAKEIEQAGTAAGFKVHLAHADGDPSKQANAVATLVSSGVKGILVDPVDAKAIVPVIQRAVAKGVVVVPVDGSVAGGPIPVQVATDNYGAGVEACNVIGKRLAGKGTALNLQGELGNLAAQNRSKGFIDCMAKDYPNMTVVSKPFDWDSAKCAQVAQTQMSTAQIDGVYAAAAQCLTPVLTVLKKQGRLKKVTEEGHVPFVVIDGTPDELNSVRDGYLTASIAQPLGEIAKYGVGYLAKALDGEKIKPGPTDHGTKIVEIDGTLRDLLAPIVVTQANVEDPALWANKK